MSQKKQDQPPEKFAAPLELLKDLGATKRGVVISSVQVKDGLAVNGRVAWMTNKTNLADGVLIDELDKARATEIDSYMLSVIAHVPDAQFVHAFLSSEKDQGQTQVQARIVIVGDAVSELLPHEIEHILKTLGTLEVEGVDPVLISDILGINPAITAEQLEGLQRGARTLLTTLPEDFLAAPRVEDKN